MDADKCQEDSNAMSEGLESAMEKMGVSDTKDQEEPVAAVGEPEQVALNGHHEAAPSPGRDGRADGSPEEVPESAPAPQTTPEAATPPPPPHVSEKVEEPAVTEAASDGEPAPPQGDGSPEKASESPQRETAEEPAGAEEMSAAVLAQPQPDGSPVKIPEAPERDTPMDATEEMEESPAAGDSMGAEELSEAALAQHKPAESPAAVSPPDVLTTGTGSETPQPEPQLSAASDPEPKVEPVPVLADQTSPEPDSVAQIVDLAVHTEEAPAAAGDVARDTAVEKEAAAAEKVLTIESPDEKAAEERSGNPVVSESVAEASPKAPVQAEEAQNVPSAEVLNAKDAEPAKEEEPKKAAEPDLPPPTAMDQVEQKEADADQMQPTKAAAAEEEEEEGGVRVPAPGSLAFALLEHEPTVAALRASRTLVVLRGLPGSGKSFLARAIADAYQGLCTVVSADDHDPASADGAKGLEEAVVARCGPATGGAASLVVVDDANHAHGRLVRLAEIAEQSRRLVLFLEPRTEWCADPPQLAKRTRRGLDEAQIQGMRAAYEEARLPLFYAWFLLQDKVKCTAMDFLKTLDTLDAFKKHLADFPVETEKEVDLEQYFKSEWALHCTTKYCGNGKAKGAKEYAEQAAVRDLYGSVFELSLTALFVTPRTVGARVALSKAQLALWPADAEKEAESEVPGAGALPPGSRAHITLGCADKVQPVQTGLDLLDILVLQESGQQGELVEEMELGSLVYLDKGRWLLTLREPISAQACFSSMYKPKEADETKKEPEKKKKAKCSIL